MFLVTAILTAEAVDGLKQPTPDINASIGIGFNYDYLKSPLDVNFENPKGFYSVNIPIRFSLGEDIIDQLFSGAAENFSDGEYFMPNMSARQFANTTIKVDVPMLWGVCSFSHINVMSMKYENMTGIPNFRYNPKNKEEYDLLLLGNLNTPFNLSLGWEAVTFGYTYKFNDIFILGVDFHRHRFYFKAGGNIDIDVYGRVLANLVGGTEFTIPVNYLLKNPIYGEYALERWTPTFAARIWRFDLLARIMFKDYAKGALYGDYEVPFFVNESNFTIDSRLNTDEYIIENIKNNNFMENRTNKVHIQTNKNMKWQLPSVLTLKYAIIPDHFWVSYSKFIGKTYMELVDKSFGNQTEFLRDGLDLRISVDLDHLILFNGKIGWFYGNMGIISINADFQDKRNILNEYKGSVPSFGKGIMLPTISGGGIIGTKLQFLLELNLLPLTALKTGLIYNF